MSEWKATGYVFTVIAILVTGVYLYVNRQQQISYSYKGCTFSYIYKLEVDKNSDVFIAAKREYGGCLCDQYLKRPTPALADSIVNLSSKFGYMMPIDSVNKLPYTNVDTLVKYRDWVFNPMISID